MTLPESTLTFARLAPSNPPLRQRPQVLHLHLHALPAPRIQLRQQQPQKLFVVLAAANACVFSVLDNLFNLLTCASVTISVAPGGAIFDGR
jgi:hypothetical protein